MNSDGRERLPRQGETTSLSQSADHTLIAVRMPFDATITNYERKISELDSWPRVSRTVDDGNGIRLGLAKWKEATEQQARGLYRGPEY